MIDWEDDIKKYRKGEMTSEEEHALEKKALKDPFLAEALEGSAIISSQEFSEDLAEIQKKISQKTKRKIWHWPLRIAASVALLAITYFAIAPYFQQNTDQHLALQKPEPRAQKSEAIDAIQDTSIRLTEEKLNNTDQRKKNSKVEKSIPANEENKINQQGISRGQPISSPAQISESPAADKLSDTAVTKAISEADRIAAQEEPITFKKEVADFVTPEKPAVSQSRTLAANRHMVQGKVLSAEDNTPIPGVNVIIKGTNQGTVTDMSGNYKLTITSTDPKLIYSFIGLQTEEVDVAGQTELTVKLQPDIAQLSEVVVTGYSPYRTDETHEPVIKLAEPEGGRRAYDKYLHNSLHYPQQALENNVKGRVTVLFTVKTDGSLDEFNVLKGLGYGCDEEVIRLVKEGPKWSPTTEDNVPVESEVRVRVKFALPE